MRMKRGNTLFVKVVTGLLAIILVIGVACFAAPDKRQVLAEENSGTVVKIEDANIDYKVKSYDDISIYRTKDTDGNFTVPTLTTDELTEAGDTTTGEWLFAGWYTNQACTSSLSSSVVFEEGKPVNAGPYYAKFVPADVLSVKFQITTGTEPTSDDTVLRCVSTVDSLKYKGIGLHLVKPDGTVGKMENNKVNTRIKARADINVGAYSYSPKVVDTESEYFFSATEIIENENFADEYIVKPYWITKDGTTVWGVSRCVTVNAVINKDVIHIPVKMDAEPENPSLTAGGESLGYVDYDADSGYAHFSLKKNISSLKSVTTYEIVGKYNDGKEVNTSFTYRNLGTKYTGNATESGTGTSTADDTWYTTFKDTDDEFVIATSADLYGLAEVVNEGDTFANKFVYVVCDIEANRGLASYNTTSGLAEWNTSKNVAKQDITDGTDYKWTSIDQFAGTFDGQMHTISGLNIDANAHICGMFQNTVASTTINDFKLVNSRVNAGSKAYTDTGSIVGIIYGGTFENIYSNAIVSGGGANTGGLIGTTNTNSFSMKNCWFDGIVAKTKGQPSMGGLIGRTNIGGIISNCLNTGDVIALNSASKHVGGLIGYGEIAGIEMKNCLNTGSIQYNSGLTEENKKEYGLIAGSLQDSTVVEAVYATSQDGLTYFADGTDITSPVEQSANIVKGSEMLGTSALSAITKNLFTYVTDTETYANESYWAIVPNDTPVLSAFADVAGVQYQAVDTSWFRTDKESFTLKDAADLYGLSLLTRNAELSKGFADETIILGADIVVNNGITYNEAGVVGETTPVEWLSIGTSDAPFKGRFDGKGNNISGIYLNATSVGNGLFGHTGTDVTIQNFSLTNSYFYSSASAYSDLGSVVGRTEGGKFDSIFSNAIVYGKCNNIGGLVGHMEGQDDFSINNCWFDGKATLENPWNNIGGLIGHVKNEIGKYTRTVTNCLNSGVVKAIDYRAKYMGGLIGLNNNGAGLTITNSLNTGELQYSSDVDKDKLTDKKTYLYGLIAGQYHPSTVLTDVYTVAQDYLPDEGYGATIGSRKEASTITGTAAMKNLQTFYTPVLKDNRHKVYWAVTDTTPILGDFIEFAGDEVDAVAIDTTWYDNSENYTLYDASDLYGFAQLSNSSDGRDFYGKTIKLGADIVIPNDGSATGWKDTAPTFDWQGIGSSTAFQGTFDGQGYEISGIYLNNTTNGSNGLFAQTGTNAKVRNLSLRNSYFYSEEAVIGSIVGTAKGTYNNIYSSAIVKATNMQIGGMVGTINGMFTMDNCWFAGKVYSSGTYHIGGLIGHIQSVTNTTQTITNCLNSGEIVSENANANYVGCLIGYCVPKISIRHCLNTGTLTYNEETENAHYSMTVGRYGGSDQSGSIYGVYTISQEGVRYSNVTPSSSYTVSDKNITGENSRQSMTRLFESKTEGGEDYWDVTDGMPYLKTFSEYAEVTEVVVADTSWYSEGQNVFTIRTADELTGLAQLVNEGNTFEGKRIELASDIYINKGEATEWEDVSHLPIINIWTPIGFASNTAFAGTFDGQGYTISGIYLNSDSEYLGLFGVLNNATIRDLRVENSYFECTANSRSDDEHGLGSIAGQGTGTLYNVYSDAILVNASTNTGGLVGSVVQQGTTLSVNNCWFTGSVTGCAKDNTPENDWIGGIVGYAKNDVTINMLDCLVAANLTSDLTGESYVGGLSGRIFGGTIRSCMVLGTINCDEQGIAHSIAGKRENAGLSIQGCYNATNRTDVTTGVIQFTNRGTGNYNIEFPGQNLNNYTSYCDTLEDKKFSKYAENSTGNENGKVYNATYVRDEIVITVVFMENTGEICISIEKDLPLSTHLLQATAYSGAERANANTSLHMLKLSKDGTKVYGDSFVIQLKNGHFIVDDGGMECEAATLYNYLKTLTPNGEKPVIDAWFISHGHSDHIGALSAFAKNKTYYDNVYVNGVYFNEPSYVNSEFYRTAINNVSKSFRTSDNEITPVYRPKTGQRYYFDDITIDVLHTQEQLQIDEYTNDFNETSTWLSYTIDGSTFLHAGDAAQNSVNKVLAHYDSSYLEFNVLATLHHAQNIYQNFLDNFEYDILLYTTWDKEPQTIGIASLYNTSMLDKADYAYSWGNGTITLTFDKDNGIQLPDGQWFKK